MSEEFTPGPWAIRRGHSVVEVRTVAGLQIAQTTSDSYWENFRDETLANARLIAAAPELYTALERMVDDHSWDDTDRSVYAGAIAVLAKARGEA